jgi:hypothetical protein
MPDAGLLALGHVTVDEWVGALSGNSLGSQPSSHSVGFAKLVSFAKEYR